MMNEDKLSYQFADIESTFQLLLRKSYQSRLNKSSENAIINM